MFTVLVCVTDIALSLHKLVYSNVAYPDKYSSWRSQIHWNLREHWQIEIFFTILSTYLAEFRFALLFPMHWFFSASVGKWLSRGHWVMLMVFLWAQKSSFLCPWIILLIIQTIWLFYLPHHQVSSIFALIMFSCQAVALQKVGGVSSMQSCHRLVLCKDLDVLCDERLYK